jgi:hypothetical protein
MNGTIAMLGDCVATTELTVEQMGQICEAEGGAVKSAQKWNWAVRKMTVKSKMRTDVGGPMTCIELT